MNLDIVKENLVNCIADDYDMIKEAHLHGGTTMLELLTVKLLNDITLFCRACEYKPEEITEGEMQKQLIGLTTPSYGKRLLSDVIVTLGLANMRRPVNVPEIYRWVYDMHYTFIPPEQRPKDDFMNKPE